MKEKNRDHLVEELRAEVERLKAENMAIIYAPSAATGSLCSSRA